MQNLIVRAFAIVLFVAASSPLYAGPIIVYGLGQSNGISSAQIFGGTLVTNGGAAVIYGDGFSKVDPGGSGNSIDVLNFGMTRPSTNDFSSSARVGFDFDQVQPDGHLLAFNLTDQDFTLGGAATGTPVRIDIAVHIVFSNGATPDTDPVGADVERTARIGLYDVTGGLLGAPLVAQNLSAGGSAAASVANYTLSFETTLDSGTKFFLRATTEAEATFADAGIGSASRSVGIDWMTSVTALDNAAVPVPEPASLLLLVTGSVAVFRSRRARSAR